MRGHFTPHTEATKKKISLVKLGIIKADKERLPYCFCGKRLSRIDAKFCKKHYWIGITGNKNPAWKEKPSYTTLHTWIRKHLGQPKKCKHCGKDGLTSHKIHWANISGKHLRNKEDWIRLCAKCHKAYDFSKKIKNDRSTISELN